MLVTIWTILKNVLDMLSVVDDNPDDFKLKFVHRTWENFIE